MLEHKQLPHDTPPYISVGGEDEAASYVLGNHRAWLNTPGAISWLRKTLDMPLPKAPKPRQPSWPELRLALRRCPQERGEVWQVDAITSSGAGQDTSAEELPWIVMIVSRASEEVLGLTAFDSPPRPGDVWECPTDVMRRPRDAEPHRPAKIEVRQKAFQTAWITDERGPYRPWMAVLQAVPLSWLSGTR